MPDYSNIPDFDSLPPVKGMPQGCAWGIFDKDGKKDRFGTLNLITPEIVKEAAKEVKEGVSVSLNWPIGSIKTPGFNRKGLVHKVLDFMDTPAKLHGFDDEIEFNTQCSSQWDSLCHYFHQPTATGYNGAQPTIAELTQDFGAENIKTNVLPTLNHWHERGGLVARGVLLDYKAYADAKGTKYSCFDAHKITIDDLEAVAKHQGTQFKFGDVLIVRSGFTEALSEMDGAQQDEALGTHKCVGVEGSEAVAKWVWNHHFASVAGDAIAFEVLPPTLPSGETGTIADLVLHQYFLSLFGLNIGELWDLKALSAQCRKSGRYEFLLTSIPLNVPGSIGSPPNALAIF